MKNLYYKGAVDKHNAKAMFEYLVGHYTYSTLNSWNGLKSIANNVKIYNLQLEGDKWLALGIVEQEEYTTINDMLWEWECEHKGYKLGFNGRSGGYIVMYNENNNGNILPNWIVDNSDYEEFKETCKDYYDSVKGAIDDLRFYVELVESFDILCDEIRDYMNELSLTNKNDMLESEFKDFLWDFNEIYEQDIKALNKKGIDLKKDDEGYYIDTTNIEGSNSLNDCLHQTLLRYNSDTSLYRVSTEKEKIRVEYKG